MRTTVSSRGHRARSGTNVNVTDDAGACLFFVWTAVVRLESWTVSVRNDSQLRGRISDGLGSIIRRFASPRRKKCIRASRRRLLPRFSYLEERSLLSTFTVTNTQDAGQGSLRWAIVQANAKRLSDTIVFSPPVFETPQVIRLSSPLPLMDPSPTTIQGPGRELLTLSGQDKTRILTVVGQARMTLTGMTLSAGRRRGGGGLRFHFRCARLS